MAFKKPVISREDIVWQDRYARNRKIELLIFGLTWVGFDLYNAHLKKRESLERAERTIEQ